MVKALPSLDWSLVQAFLAVAEAGSLSEAARRLNLSQPTLGRRVQAVEDALRTTLFDRQPRGMALTEPGLQLLAPARAMHEAAGRLALTAAGGAQELAGTVRITASIFTAHHVLPEILATLRRETPEIAIELVASDTSENLLFREADIAIRMYRPGQLDVVTRHLGDLALGLFGAKSYLDRTGRPQSVEDLRAHDFVGYDTDDQIIRGMREFGWPVDREFFGTRCDHQTVYWQLVRAGCGLGFSQVGAARDDPLVEEIATDLPIPSLPVWLAAHQKMRRTPRIRHVWDHLAKQLQGLVS